MQYTAVIRTLGIAGKKYQQMLNSLENQTIQPCKIIVYIAEGYPLPQETISKEQYVYVKKGMVAQRALQYDEVTTEYILFLDDDVYLPPTGVERLYKQLIDNDGEVISPDVFPNAQRTLKSEFMMTISGRMRARRNDEQWGYKVMRTSGYSYNKTPQSVLLSQSNAGSCFFCKKKTFLGIHFEDELWMDRLKYALGDDQVMFYKMYLKGYRVLTSYDSGIIHLDAGSTMQSEDKVRNLIYSDFRFKTIFWHRFIWPCQNSVLQKMWSVLCVVYAFGFALGISLIKGQWHICRLKYNAMCDGISFIKSEEYKRLPKVV